MTSLFSVSVAATIALHSAALLSRSRSALRARQLAAALGASEAHLSKVLQRLTRAGLVLAKRGPSGGFVLAKSPDDITLKDILEAIEGPIEAETCPFGVHTCKGNDCPLADEFSKAGRKLLDFMESTKLSDYQDNLCVEVTLDE